MCLLPLVLPFVPIQPASAASAPAAAKHAAAPVAAYNTFGLTKEVFGYAYAASLGDPNVGYPSWNFDLLATVAFFSIHVNDQGILVADSNWNVWNSSTLTGLVTTAHAHGVKVVVTLRAGGAALCGALYGYQSTVDQIVAQVQAKGVDGVNIDYEGQLATCTNPNAGQPNYTNQYLVTNLAKVLRQALDAAKPGYYLSIATYSGSASGTDGFFNIPDLNQWVDSFFVMAYDMDEANQGSPPLQSCPRFCMAPVSPLTNYYWNDTNSMLQYSSVVGAGKVILGQPYYGRVACVASPGSNAMTTSSPQVATYLDSVAAISSADVRPGTYSINRDAADVTGVDRWDAWYDNYYGCWREMYWSDVTTLSNRYDLVNQDNLRGVGIWTLSYAGGAQELWTALQSHFVACMNTAVTPTPAPPQLSGTAVQLVASTSACVNPRYEFWMQPPGGTWRVVQGYSTNPTYNWNTTWLVPGTYRFSVWARDMNSRGPFGSAPNTYDSFARLDYPLTVQPCTGMTATATPSAAVVGGAVTITGAATGCPNPSYEFWLQPPGGAWSIAQPYSTSASFTWNTAGRPAGNYRVSVWARDASSLGTGGGSGYTYDAFYGFPYTLSTPNCAGMTAAANPATTANRGTQVTITASVSGCPNPLYEFWLLPPGGTWRVVQGYTSSATFTWNTTAAMPAGKYRFSVWTRDAYSPNAYDSFSAFDYTLGVAPCTGMTTSQNPASTAPAGSQVVITAAATGCPSPLYEFWMQAPGGAWMVVQAWSSSATFTWSAKTAGSYRFSVWARDASSSGTSGTPPYTYDAFSAFPYTLT